MKPRKESAHGKLLNPSIPKAKGPEIDLAEMFRNIKFLTFCKCIGTDFLMINRARVGSFAMLKNSIFSNISPIFLIHYKDASKMFFIFFVTS